MANAFQGENVKFLCGSPTEYDKEKERKSRFIYDIAVEHISDNIKLLDMLNQNIPTMVSITTVSNLISHNQNNFQIQSMFENSDKLKAYQQFIFNENINSIFCNIWVANEYYSRKKNTKPEYSSIYYGHHVMLLIPINIYYDGLTEKVCLKILNIFF